MQMHYLASKQCGSGVRSSKSDVHPYLRFAPAQCRFLEHRLALSLHKRAVMLSDRERMIAERYATGETHKEIAAALNIAPATVRNHLASIYRKLGVKNKPELIGALSENARVGIVLPTPESNGPTLPILRMLDDDALPPTARASVAVIPFANIGPGEKDYFSHGVTADIHHNLTRFRDLFVSGRSSCLALSEQTVDVIEASRRLGVQYVVQGTVRSHEDTLRITAELVDGANGGVLWSERYDRVLNDIFEVEMEVANAIAGFLSVRIEDAQYTRR
jgi:TolB-like protein/DNA-binding CsgD family transcriptional regulator